MIGRWRSRVDRKKIRHFVPRDLRSYFQCNVARRVLAETASGGLFVRAYRYIRRPTLLLSRNCRRKKNISNTPERFQNHAIIKVVSGLVVQASGGETTSLSLCAHRRPFTVMS